MAHIRVEITIKGSDRASCLNFSHKQDALDQWDKSVDHACPGDKLRLIDLETGALMSVYSPVDRSITDD